MTGLAQLLDSDGKLITSNNASTNSDSIVYWVERYWTTKVLGSAAGTMRAKKDDLQLFFGFFQAVVGSEDPDYWTPSITKSFKGWLQKENPSKPKRSHEKAYAPTSINRILATLRHFARYVSENRPFEAGNPFDGVKDLAIKNPEWNGLEDLTLMRLRAALDQVSQLSTRASQMPLRNRAVFTMALNTGLRAFEIENLEFSQYLGKYLKNVRGKGENYDDVYLSADARRELDQYIEKERGRKPGPLFLTNRAGRMSRQQIDRFLRRIATHANAKLPKEEQIHLHAHMLRHTGIKKVHGERGELAAKRFSRHRSFAQLERYATQTREEHESMVDNLWS